MPNRKQGIKSLEGGMVGEVALYFEKVLWSIFSLSPFWKEDRIGENLPRFQPGCFYSLSRSNSSSCSSVSLVSSTEFAFFPFSSLILVLFELNGFDVSRPPRNFRANICV